MDILTDDGMEGKRKRWQQRRFICYQGVQGLIRLPNKLNKRINIS